jgi:hypothetical protein
MSAIPKRIKTVIIRVNGKPGRNATEQNLRHSAKWSPCRHYNRHQRRTAWCQGCKSDMGQKYSIRWDAGKHPRVIESLDLDEGKRTTNTPRWRNRREIGVLTTRERRNNPRPAHRTARERPGESQVEKRGRVNRDIGGVARRGSWEPNRSLQARVGLEGEKEAKPRRKIE